MNIRMEPLMEEKMKLVKELLIEYQKFSSIEKPTLIDIGCRDCILSKFIPQKIQYIGLDMFQNQERTVNHVGCFPIDFSFHSKQFNVSCALDCLEHMDDIKNGLEEMLRITSEMAIIVLPNMAHILHRLRFFFTGRINGKYDLSADNNKDRHRWLTITEQADALIKDIATKNGFSCEIVYLKKTGKIWKFFELLFGFLGPNMISWASLYKLERQRRP